MAGDATPALYRNLTAIAVREGVIVGLGSDEAIIRNSPDALVTDLEGTVLMPGLIDSHNHFLRTALDWERLQLGEVRSTEELLDAVGQRTREIPPGQWLLCSSRWHETNLSERQMPTAQQLDWAAPNNRSTCPEAVMWWSPIPWGWNGPGFPTTVQTPKEGPSSRTFRERSPACWSRCLRSPRSIDCCPKP